MSNEKIIHLTKEEVLYCLKDSEYIHTYKNAAFGLIGADWQKNELIDLLDEADDIQIGGEGCRSMGHGIVIFPSGAKYQSQLVFVECDNDKLLEIEKTKENNND